MTDFIATGLPLSLVVRLASVAAALVLARRPGACRGLTLGGSILASLTTLAVALRVIGTGQGMSGVLFEHPATGLALTYTVTPLSAWFLMVLGLVAAPVAFYSVSYFAHSVAPPRTALACAAFTVMVGAMETVFVADGVMTFLMGWEVMTLATAALVATEHQERSSRRAAYLYLVMSHIGTGCLMAAFLIMASSAGTLSFPGIFAAGVVSGTVRQGVFALFFVGFAVKAGLIPFHVWLPEAHPAAPSSVSAFMSAVSITAGLYGLFRVCAFGLGTPDLNWGIAFLLLGTLSAILGVLYALTETDLKRLLAYSTIENSGIIVLGLGASMLARGHGRGSLATVAAAASLMHVLNHAIFKSLLFLGAGGVVMSTGTREIEQFGGLLRRMPWTSLCFLVGALAISGLPLLNGFPSEWLTFQALLLGFTSTPGLVRLNFPLAGAMLALTSALAAACFVRAFGISFLALPRSRAAAEAHEAPSGMIASQVFLAVLCLGFGLAPGMVLSALDGVTASLPGLQPATSLAGAGLGLTSGLASFDQVVPAVFGLAFVSALVVAGMLASRGRATARLAATWGCGGTLTPSTEYTATAFSKPLLMIFRSVYRPTRQVAARATVSPYFVEEVHYRAEIERTFERFLYGPLAHGIERAARAMKVLQAGSLHAYLAYVLVLAVVLLMWLGGAA